ncbi:MAG TPA: hypothetical protein VF092_09165 [Longimicrobium sp.]
MIPQKIILHVGHNAGPGAEDFVEDFQTELAALPPAAGSLVIGADEYSIIDQRVEVLMATVPFEANWLPPQPQMIVTHVTASISL